MKHPEQSYARETIDRAYAFRLTALSGEWWKKALDVQRPYRWNIRRLRLGRTLDVGCGIGRNLKWLPSGSVGVDHNSQCVEIAKSASLLAFIPKEFPGGTFDTLLFSHVLEHLEHKEADELVGRYLPNLRQGGRVVFITPQEAGYHSDQTHVRFVDFSVLSDTASRLSLDKIIMYSFPFPRYAGRLFRYNEFIFVAAKR